MQSQAIATFRATVKPTAEQLPMIFGHLPASYLALTLTEKWWGKGLDPQESKVVYGCGILTGVAPDVDVLFAGISAHRGSIVHTPFFWVLCAMAVALLAVVLRRRRRLLLHLALAILLGAATHLLLDAIFTGIKLLYPLSNEYFRMISPISLRYENWLVNYLLHPIFLTEIYAFIGAAMLWRYQRARRRSPGVAGVFRPNSGAVAIAGLITALYAINWYAGT